MSGCIEKTIELKAPASKVANGLACRSAAAATVFAALGDPTRLALVTRLCDRSRCSIAQLTQGRRITRQAISKHLRVLESARVVVSERSGRENLFALNPAPIEDIKTYIELVSGQWDSALPATLGAWTAGTST